LEPWAAKYAVNSFGNAVLVRIGSGLAANLVHGVGNWFYSVAISETGKLPRRSKFINNDPSPANLQRFKALEHSNPGGNDGSGVALVPASTNPWGGLGVKRVLEYLHASLFIKDIKQIDLAKSAFLPLLVKATFNPRELHTDRLHGNALRRSRVNLDATAMLLFRAFYKTLNPDLTWVFIFLDASPQERGRELFAASFDLICRSAPEFCQRRYFAGVRIGHDLLSALGKTIALLWQIFLQIGPDFNLMRQFCSSVAGICSDLGTERLIARGADILIDFFNFIGAPVPGSTSRPSSKRVATPKSVLLYVLSCCLYFAHYLYE
jgi:hypothetical protein